MKKTKKLVPVTRTTTTLWGALRPMPKDLEELDAIRQDGDGCKFTFQDMVNCGAYPPPGTEDHVFIVAYGDLCVYPPDENGYDGCADDMSYIWANTGDSTISGWRDDNTEELYIAPGQKKKPAKKKR